MYIHTLILTSNKETHKSGQVFGLVPALAARGLANSGALRVALGALRRARREGGASSDHFPGVFV